MMKRLIFLSSLTVLTVGLTLALPSAALAYGTAFTLNFDTADTTGWSDTVNTPATDLQAGSTTPADSPAYSPAPNDVGAGFDGTGWFRIGQPAGDTFGVGLAVYDGTAGGSTTDPTDYIFEADVFVVVSTSIRNQQGLVGRWTTASGNFPFEVFHSHNTPGSADGYGYRGGGSTAEYGLFPAETSNRWVRMRMTFHGTQVDIAIDTNKDGTWDHTQTDISISDTAGDIGFFSVINDPNNGSAGVASQYSYFDNAVFSLATEVKDWTLY